MSTADITLCAMMGLLGGDTARKRLSCRKLNLVDADINACSFLVNLPDRLMLTKERLHLVAEIS